MLEDYLKFAIDGIAHRRLRSWLTMIGIFIGIVAVVALISLGQGMQNAIDEQLKKVGSNRIIITPGGGGAMAGPTTSEFVAAKLYEDDVDVVKKVRGVEDATGVLIKNVRVKFGDKSRYVMCFAGNTDPKTIDFIQNIDYFMVDKGKYPKEGEKYKATIGPDLWKKFDKEIKLGDKIEIEGREFEVAVITKKSGSPIQDTKVGIPLETAREMFNIPEEVMIIFVETKPGFNPSDVAEDIKEKLRKDHNVKKGEEDFSVQTAEQMIGRFKEILDTVQIVLIGIAAISLIVGGIGIMTTMYTSIIERTNQIGIMKAIGAKNSDILLLFLIEAGLLGLVGGVMGVLIGLVISKGVEILAAEYGLEMLKAYMGWELILGALAFSFIVGCISGLLPARRASKMNPVDALRYR